MDELRRKAADSWSAAASWAADLDGWNLRFLYARRTTHLRGDRRWAVIREHVTRYGVVAGRMSD